MKALVDSTGKLLVNAGKIVTDACPVACCGPPACGETCTPRNLTELNRITITFALDATASSGDCSVSINRTISHTWRRINHIFPSGGETIGADQFVFYQEPNPGILPEPGCLRTLRFQTVNEIAYDVDDSSLSICSTSVAVDDPPGGPEIEGDMQFTFTFTFAKDSCESPRGGFSGELAFTTGCAFTSGGDGAACGTAKDIFSSPSLGISALYDYFGVSLIQTNIFTLSDSGTDLGGPWDYTATVTVAFAA